MNNGNPQNSARDSKKVKKVSSNPMDIMKNLNKDIRKISDKKKATKKATSM